MSVGFNYKTQDGEIFQAVMKNKSVSLSNSIKKQYGFITKEEELYYQIYADYKFDKLDQNWVRIVTKDNLTRIHKSSKKRLLVAEFGKLPIYFPMYFGAKKDIYGQHKLDIEFISTGGDDLTYNSLMNGSAQVGIADPIFTFTDNKYKIKGKIVGQLIGKVPLFGVALNPSIKINNLSELKDFSVGTFQKFSTTNTIMKELLPEKEFIPINNTKILESLKNRDFDIAVVTAGYAYDLLAKGGHIVFNLEQKYGDYLFTGVSVSDNLDKEHLDAVKVFNIALKESINYIRKNKREALLIFRKEFPHLLDPEPLFDYLISIWNTKLSINANGLKRATHTWKTVYPWLLKANSPQFIEPRKSDQIISIFNKRNVSRDIIYKEDLLAKTVQNNIKTKTPVHLVGFWGASDKEVVDNNDINALKKFEEINQQVKKIYSPGCKFTFILADEHARLNKYPKTKYIKYLNQIVKEIKKYGMNFVYLSELYKKEKITSKDISNEIKNITKDSWRDLRNRKDLEKSAKNKGFQNPVTEAKRYYAVRVLESHMLKKNFPESIYHTYYEDIHQNLFPDIPTLYLWVGKRGYTHSPWFVK